MHLEHPMLYKFSCRLGLLQVGDRILSINSVRVEGVMLSQAIKLVQEAKDTIEMEVEFDVTGRSFLLYNNYVCKIM